MALPIHAQGWQKAGIVLGFGLIGWSIASDEPQLDVPPEALATAKAYANPESAPAPTPAPLPTAATAPAPGPATKAAPHAQPSAAAQKPAEAKPAEPKPPPVEEKKLDTLEAIAGTWAIDLDASVAATRDMLKKSHMHANAARADIEKTMIHGEQSLTVESSGAAAITFAKPAEGDAEKPIKGTLVKDEEGWKFPTDEGSEDEEKPDPFEVTVHGRSLWVARGNTIRVFKKS